MAETKNKRHLIIALATNTQQTLGFIQYEMVYRRTKQTILGEYNSLRRAKVPGQSEDGVVAVVVTAAEMKSKSSSNRLRPFLEWLVDGVDQNDQTARSPRKLSFLGHGGGGTTVQGHSDNGPREELEMEIVMNSICEAGVIKGGKVTGQWDGNNAKCQECGKTFSRFLISGRHHCRICGKSVCSRAECSTKREVSNALLKRGNTNETHHQRAKSSSFRREWVCKTCVENVLVEAKNLLDRLGVLRLCVCSGALKKTGKGGRYIPVREQSRLHHIKTSSKGYVYKDVEDSRSIKNILIGELPNLSIVQPKNGPRGIMVKDYVPETVAGQAVKILRRFKIKGVRVTAAKGVYRMPNDGGKTTIVTDQRAGNFQSIETNKLQYYNPHRIIDYGSDTLVNFTDEKFYVMT